MTLQIPQQSRLKALSGSIDVTSKVGDQIKIDEA